MIFPRVKNKKTPMSENRDLPKEKKGKVTSTIALNTLFVIFGLASAFTGTYAWFNAEIASNSDIGNFQVVVLGSASLNSVRLIKFDYGTTDYGSLTTIDWLTPETGHVNMYEYNYETSSFGVDAMNPYDPVERVVRGTTLKELNCNAIYEVTFLGGGAGTSFLELSSSIFSVVKDKPADILLSDCVDIDLFFKDDLDDNNPSFVVEDNIETNMVNEYDNLVYYPSYKLSKNNKYYIWDESQLDWEKSNTAPIGEGYTNRGMVNYESCLPSSPSNGDYYKVLKTPLALGDSAEEIENAEIYYKISYLSSLIEPGDHSHFYGSPKSSRILVVENEEIEFVGDEPITVYLNVNYAPSIADTFMRDIYLQDIVAKYDYGFKFDFLGEPRS